MFSQRLETLYSIFSVFSLGTILPEFEKKAVAFETLGLLQVKLGQS